MFAFKSLQQRMVVFLLLPVALLVGAIGWGAFVYARNSLLSEWQEATMLKLQRAAHHVDMRLNEAKAWMQMFHRTAGEPQAEIIQKWIVKQLNELEGVERAALIHLKKESTPSSRFMPMMGMGRATPPGKVQWGGMMAFQRAHITRVEPPRYDARADRKTVTLISDLLDGGGEKIGKLEVVVRFDYLTQDVFSKGWGKGEMASLVDDEGNVLTCNFPGSDPKVCFQKEMPRTLVADLKQKSWGTLLGKKPFESQIIGFYHLKEAPWTLVLAAGDEQILAPILRFRRIFLAAGTLCVLLIVVLIRVLVGRTVSAISDVSVAAQQVARGNYQVQLSTSRSDEVGQLVRSFNTMVTQLEDRMRLKAALVLAMEVQQNLLPSQVPDIEGLDIAGISLYCDETGGDYYDFLGFPELGADKVGIAIGDVAGHGIPAALLMTTARAMLRTRIMQPGNLSLVVADVNRLLCYDTERTGDFMTLFLMTIEAKGNTLRWVRAGHPPALIYDCSHGTFESLSDGDNVLGLLESSEYKEYSYNQWNESKVLFIGTDGIWEAENPHGEMFGMERLYAVIRKHGDRPADAIVQAVVEELNAFRQSAPQNDDITMVVVKKTASNHPKMAP